MYVFWRLLVHTDAPPAAMAMAKIMNHDTCDSIRGPHLPRRKLPPI